MTLSMTGFGKAQGEHKNKKFNVEIRSLNSKGLDLNVRMASLYREKELDLRNRIARAAERGKIDVSIYFETSADQKLAINKPLLMAYYQELKSISSDLGGVDSPDYLGLLIKMPEVLQTQREELDEEEWNYILQLVDQALAHFTEFRAKEGAVLARELKQRVASILYLLEQVIELSKQRETQIRQRLWKGLEELSERINIDQNRFEQEIVYYLEKLDVTEEQVRLKAHCDYFVQTIDQTSAEGKKLGFIAQEMGREINTIGSKCNDADIQRFVVQMKDELEKIKEQSLNLL